ncbi:sensor histidine kinase [Actinomadura sp. HBU206391]|uniref:GAF domain-containing sensor histidine kinase n=1 Tax=Actinomadura sp. HBU206391 TaxID=2731692 RepID=UPI00164F07C2|nr:sensor histidine kinase [Actinomadura sp. HBU206391]MBC6461049.1 sensor histidine kinase [Actinomadura sp. HBU206391]
MTARAAGSVPPVETLMARGPDLLARALSTACSDRELPGLAAELAELVVASATSLSSCTVYVLDEDERVLEHPGSAPVPLGEGRVGWAASHGLARSHEDGRGAALPVRSRDTGTTVAVIDVRSARHCLDEDLELVTALAALLSPVLCAARRLRTARERERSAERFAERAIEVQEAERARLARDVHDGIAQRLAGLGFHLSAADRALPGHREQARTQIRLARGLCELAAAETRATIGGLRPPVLDDLGLSAALAALAREAGRRQASLDVGMAVSGELAAALPDHVQTALYRIAQEAVGNCLRHAAAQCVDIVLAQGPDRVVLTVVDDGAGFSRQDVLSPGGRPGTYGLRGMAERAELLGGRLSMTSRPGAGTTVRVTVPVPSERDGA